MGERDTERKRASGRGEGRKGERGKDVGVFDHTHAHTHTITGSRGLGSCAVSDVRSSSLGVCLNPKP
jgi:hypothetical protein